MKYNEKQVDCFTRFKNECSYYKLMDAALQNAVGNIIKNKTVLDIGCGEGHLTRLLKQWGAAEITGVDLSKPMLDLAKEREKTERLGITYLETSVQDMGKIGEFDIITSGLLLTNAADVPDLKVMVKNIAANCKHGTRYFGQEHCGILNRYNNTLLGKYNFEVEILSSCKEYLDLILTGHFSQGEMSFRNLVFEREFLNSVFKDFGFEKIHWHPLQLPEGHKEGDEFTVYENIRNEAINELMDCTYSG
ncbi:MAG: class I SAM-dependent methyltransferase [Lentisphaerae bacterium]|nr:class I SAM-dependent methyltransferase [Lentisphaerota bacterium]MCP4101347.1 class I SAM-dependent methyltransferase [Lentisphaerota bacterium]